jgi:hypothetical protein
MRNSLRTKWRISCNLGPVSSSTSTEAILLRRIFQLEDHRTTLKCVCGNTDGRMFIIRCTNCQQEVHAACYGITRHNAPLDFQCWICSPEEHILRRLTSVTSHRHTKEQQHWRTALQDYVREHHLYDLTWDFQFACLQNQPVWHAVAVGA